MGMGITVNRDIFELRKNYDLQTKILFAKARIIEFYNELFGKVCVFYSGGKDSSVLLHIIREIYPDIKVMFNNTRVEHPEVIRFIRNIPGVDWVTSDTTFKEVTEKYGWPVISKEVSKAVYSVRRGWRIDKYLGNGRFRLPNKWRFLLDAPFKINSHCCDELKKKPSRKYMRQNGLIGFFTGERATESRLRLSSYLIYGCNSYTSTRKKSTPLAIWTSKDIEDYLQLFNVPYPENYYKYNERTGCVPCLFGIAKDTERFLRLKDNCQKYYDWCFNVLGIKSVLDYISVPY